MHVTDLLSKFECADRDSSGSAGSNGASDSGTDSACRRGALQRSTIRRCRPVSAAISPLLDSHAGRGLPARKHNGKPTPLTPKPIVLLSSRMAESLSAALRPEPAVAALKPAILSAKPALPLSSSRVSTCSSSSSDCKTPSDAPAALHKCSPFDRHESRPTPRTPKPVVTAFGSPSSKKPAPPSAPKPRMTGSSLAGAPVSVCRSATYKTSCRPRAAVSSGPGKRRPVRRSRQVLLKRDRAAVQSECSPSGAIAAGTARLSIQDLQRYVNRLPLPDGAPPPKPPRSHPSTTVTIRRRSDQTPAAVEQDPCPIRRRSAELASFRPASRASPALQQPVYAEPSAVANSQPTGAARLVQPYAVSAPLSTTAVAVDCPLRRSCSDETLHPPPDRPPPGYASTALIAELVAQSALRRNPAFSRQQRPSVRSLCCTADNYAAANSALLKSMTLPSFDDRLSGATARRSWQPSELSIQRRRYVHRTRILLTKYGEQSADDSGLFYALVVVGLSTDQHGNLQPSVLSQYPTDVSLPSRLAELCFTDVSRWSALLPGVQEPPPGPSGALYLNIRRQTDANGSQLLHAICQQLSVPLYNLPVTYCILTRHCAPALYTQMLSVLMELHGIADTARVSILSRLYGQKFPAAQGQIVVPLPPSTVESPDDFVLPNQQWADYVIMRPRDWLADKDALHWLLGNIGISNFTTLLASALLERTILFFSSDISVLWRASSAVLAALCPFVWQHCLVPVLPPDMTSLLTSGAPCIVGVLSDDRPLKWIQPLEQAVCVDLDSAQLVYSVGDEHSILPACISESLTSDSVSPLARVFHKLAVNIHPRHSAHQHANTTRGNASLQMKSELLEQCADLDMKQFIYWFCDTSMFRGLVDSFIIDDNLAADTAESLFSPPGGLNGAGVDSRNLLEHARRMARKLRSKLSKHDS